MVDRDGNGASEDIVSSYKLFLVGLRRRVRRWLVQVTGPRKKGRMTVGKGVREAPRAYPQFGYPK